MITNALGEGMTGSGKKDFCVCVLDEAALDGGTLNHHRSEGIHQNLPIIQALRKEDFRSWINE
ncbi:MAG: hypothetical protein NO516_04065 [Candidatus Methanomethylicia archaeon]|nr:hypothetical protein [Candidatus Methanomethylicia archaeon]